MMKNTTQNKKSLTRLLLSAIFFFGFTLHLVQGQTTTVELEILPVVTNSNALGEVQTMTSAVTTHPAGGTFTVTYDVDPGATMLYNGGGVSPLQWAVNTLNTRFFEGPDGSETANVSNIQVVIIDDNGGSLTTDVFSDLKFVSASLGNAANNNDAGVFTYNGGVTEFTFVKQATDPAVFPFQTSPVVTSFNVGVNTAVASNKWGIAGVKISVTYLTDILSSENINGFAEKGYKLYPNPASSVLYVESEGGAKITVFNTIGAQVLEISNADKKQKINTSSFAKGVYFIRVNDTVSKLIVE